MTPRHQREIPHGFQLDWDTDIWNIWHAFDWSDVFNGWVDIGQITVRPGQSLPEAFVETSGVEMSKEIEIFFPKQQV